MRGVDSTGEKLISLRFEGLRVEFRIHDRTAFGPFQRAAGLTPAVELSVGRIEADLGRWVTLHSPDFALGVAQTLDGAFRIHAGQCVGARDFGAQEYGYCGDCRSPEVTDAMGTLLPEATWE
jgi:hypothetical protein